MSDVDQIITFLQEINQFKFVKRKTILRPPEPGKNWYENDAEHTWHMCMFVMLLHKHLSVEVDLLHTLKITLVHDLVELYDGDVSSFDVEGRVGKEEREQVAANKLFGILPAIDEEELHALWNEYEKQETPEARFAKACDRMQALSQNVQTDGYTWTLYNTTEAKSRAHNEQQIKFDPFVGALFDRLYAIANERDLYNKRGIK